MVRLNEDLLFVAPVRSIEVLVGKTFPYFVPGLLGLALSVIGSLVLVGVPLRGSLLVLTGVSILYLLVALGIGLVISSATKSQSLAVRLPPPPSQAIALTVSRDHLPDTLSDYSHTCCDGKENALDVSPQLPLML